MNGLCILFIALLTLPLAQCGGENKFARQALNNNQRQLAAELNEVTKSYLVKNLGVTSSGGKAFCTYKILDLEQEGNTINEYVYAVCQEYYIKNGELSVGTGASTPMALALRKEGDVYIVTSHKAPRGGAQFRRNVEEIFPKKTVDEVIESQFSYQSWKQELETEAKRFFGI